MSVPLPARSEAVRQSVQREPVWTVEPGAVPSASSVREGAPIDEDALKKAPFDALCEAKTRPDDRITCCRDLKDEKRTLLDPELVRNIILGLADGLTVPFGVTAGLAAIASSRIVVAGGVAEMISGALSMGVGGYLSAKADRDHFRYLRDYTRQRIRRSCVGEVEREVTEVLQQVGLDESLCRTVALRLLKVENELNVAADERALQQKNQSFIDRVLHKVARKPMMTRHEKATAFDAAEKGLSQTRSGSTAVAANEFGVTAFLLKFAEGQEDVPNLQLLTTAVTIGIAYALGALVSLLPYFFVKDVLHALYISIGVTGATLLVFGVVKAYFTGAKIGFRGYAKSAFETLFVGALAAGAAYGIGRAIEKSSI